MKPGRGVADTLTTVVVGLGLLIWATPMISMAAMPPVGADGQPPGLRCGKARALAQRHLAGQARRQERQEYERRLVAEPREAFEDTNLLRCDVEIEIIPSQYDNIVGSNTMTIRSKSSALTEFTFRLRDSYTIDSATINGATPITVTNLSTTTWVATLDRTYYLYEIFTLTIEYHGHAESEGFGSIRFTTHGGSDEIVYTLSDPYYSYTWCPVKDGDWGEPGDNSDKFRLDMAVIAPSWMVTASNGLRQGVDILSGFRRRFRWSSNYPIATYLVCFSSTNYNTWSQTYVPLAGGTMPVDFYIYPEHDNPSARAAWDKVVDMLYTLRDLFGEYPFVDEKYGIYECQFGGGMEHQTFTAQGTFSEAVTVHELGHQWWGDMITCKTWNHIWLNEGFATYTEGLWEEFQSGSSGLPALKSFMTSVKYTGAGSVYVTNDELDSLYDIFDIDTSYHKGAWVLHMLRHVLGDDGFFDALAAYRAAFEYGAATTEDFQAVCETFYDGSLDWFFQEWVYGERVPAYSWGWDSVQVNGQDYLLVHIDQTQSAAYQRFSMPIDIVADGTTYVVFNNADPEHFVIPVPSAPAWVEFDPDAWALWSTRGSTSYVPGPPKIVETQPALGEVIIAGPSVQPVTVTFHTDVNTDIGDYSLVGAATGAQSFAFGYNSGTNTTTLIIPSPLPVDDFTLTVADTTTAADSGDFLDGEIADLLSPTSLPSGEGVEGGSAVISFAVICGPGDANCNGHVDLGDYAAFQTCFTGPDAGPPPIGCAMMRLDPDTDVDLADYDLFADLLDGP